MKAADFGTGCFSLGISGQTTLTSFKKFLTTLIVKVGIDSFSTARLSNTFLVTQSLQEDPDFLFG
jgi:glycerol kinase